MVGVITRSSPSGDRDAGTDLGPDLGRRRPPCHRRFLCSHAPGAGPRSWATSPIAPLGTVVLGRPPAGRPWNRLGSLGYARFLEIRRRYASSRCSSGTARPPGSLCILSKSIVPWPILDSAGSVDSVGVSWHLRSLGWIDLVRAIRPVAP